jgi:ribosomal subunit interface protein
MMQSPLRITFRGATSSPALEAKIRDKAAKLEEFHPSIISCHVAVEEEARHHQQGRLFKVRIDLHVPGHDLAVNRDHHEDVFVALRDAFDAAKRVLEDDAG